jgi:DNA-directed RNA polymerase specialized sigma24 family protein
MANFKNCYDGVVGRSDSKLIGDFVMRFLDRNRVYFGELNFDDLYQECVMYFHLQKEKSWKKAEFGGMPYRAFILAQCKNRLIHILRTRSTWGRGEAASKPRFSARFGDDTFEDSGDMEILDICEVSGSFRNAESKMIFEEAFHNAYKSLTPMAQKVLAVAVNEHLSHAAIGRRLGISGQYVCYLR